MLAPLRRLLSQRQVLLTCILVTGLLAAGIWISPGYAQQKRHDIIAPVVDGNAPIPDKPALGAIGAQLNANTIAIVSGNINAAWLTLAYDLSAVLDDGDNFRVLPVVGEGGGGIVDRSASGRGLPRRRQRLGEAPVGEIGHDGIRDA